MSKQPRQSVTLSVRTLIIIAVSAVLIIALGITLVLNRNNPSDKKAAESLTVSQTAPDIDPNASEWKGQQPENKGDDKAAGIKIPGYPSITLPKDTTDVTVALLNPEGNPCYFTFELVLKDTDETLYKSKLVSPGQAITNITLSRPLSEGSYNATIKITTASLTDQSPMNGANVETVLIVK